MVTWRFLDESAGHPVRVKTSEFNMVEYGA
jgi:hypothetical protein